MNQYQLSIITKAIHDIGSNHDPDLILKSLVDHGLVLINASAGAYGMYLGNTLIVDTYNVERRWESVAGQLHSNTDLPDWVLYHPTPNQERLHSKETMTSPAIVQLENDHSLLITPILSAQNNTLYGMLRFYRKNDGTAFTRQDLDSISILTACAAAALNSTPDSADNLPAHETPNEISQCTKLEAIEEVFFAMGRQANELIDHVKTLILILDSHGHIARINLYFSEILGYSIKEIKGKHLSDIFIPVDKKFNLNKLTALESTAGTIDGTITSKNREQRYLECTYTVMRDSNGIIIGFLISGKDKTELIKGVHALRQSEERFRNLIENTSDWIWEINVDGIYTYSSPQAESILGYKPEAMLGKSPFHLMPPAEALRLKSSILDIINNRQPIIRLENAAIHASGERVELETSGVPFYDRNGIFSGYRGIDRDITARKTAEKALQKELMRNKFILENTRDGLLIGTLQGRIREVNTAYCDLVRYGRSELIGMNIAEIETSATLGSINQRIIQVIQDGHAQFETRHQCRDGKFIELEISASIASVGDDQFIFCFCRDITERKKSHKNRINEIKHQRDTLVKEVHHRIKNHLHGVVNLLRYHIDNNPKLSEALESAISQVGTIALVHGLHCQLGNGRIDYFKLINSICNASNNLTLHTLELNCQDIGYSIYLRELDAVPIALIINELVLNAIKHTSSLSGQSIIMVELFIKNGEVVLQILNPSEKPLPIEFDFKTRSALGTGLSLCGDLLPHEGARLTIDNCCHCVAAKLTTWNPVVELENKTSVQFTRSQND